MAKTEGRTGRGSDGTRAGGDSATTVSTSQICSFNDDPMFPHEPLRPPLPGPYRLLFGLFSMCTARRTLSCFLPPGR